MRTLLRARMLSLQSYRESIISNSINIATSVRYQKRKQRQRLLLSCSLYVCMSCAFKLSHFPSETYFRNNRFCIQTNKKANLSMANASYTFITIGNDSIGGSRLTITVSTLRQRVVLQPPRKLQ